MLCFSYKKSRNNGQYTLRLTLMILQWTKLTIDKPGLMYECHSITMFLGCKEIITAGWDIGDISKFSGDNQNEEQWRPLLWG